MGFVLQMCSTPGHGRAAAREHHGRSLRSTSIRRWAPARRCLAMFYTLIATLTFWTSTGHRHHPGAGGRLGTMPVGTSGLGANALGNIALYGSQLFRGALMVALPGLTALLIVNLAFGVVSRAAPSLNLFAIGFPVTLIGGLLIVLAGLPAVQSGFITLMRETMTSPVADAVVGRPWQRPNGRTVQNRQHQKRLEDAGRRAIPRSRDLTAAAVMLTARHRTDDCR